MHSSDKTLVETLTRSKVFRDYESAFRDAVDLPLAFTTAQTWGLPLHEDKNEARFCELMARSSKACAACLQLQQRLQSEAADTAHGATLKCLYGLCDSAVPVRVGDRLLGYLRTGQVFTAKPTEEDFNRTAATLQDLGVQVQSDELRDAYFATRVVTPDQYQAILRLLKVFAEHLGSVSNQILVTEEATESPQIARAKEYIAENMAEDISLSDCARTAHMSTFYFCKMFKRATGLTFTEYISRLRTERAKERLLDPHVRISEVAFEVGFQSLSQFNRVFKNVTGQSPTEYRRQLVARSTRQEMAAAKPAALRRFPATVNTPASRPRLATAAR